MNEIYAQSLDRCLRLIAIRPRTISEIRQYLHKKEIPELVIEKVVATLSDRNYLNDADFAKWFIEQRLKFRPKSLYLIKQELRQKGVSKETLDVISTEVEVDDTAQAKALIERKMRHWVRLSPKELKEKVSRFLLARGYNWEVANSVLASILKNEDES